MDNKENLNGTQFPDEDNVQLEKAELSFPKSTEELFSMESLQISLTPDEGMMDAEKNLSEYLLKAGVVIDPSINQAKRAEDMQRQRRENYLNVESLLESYRSLNRTYIIMKEEFAQKLQDEVHLASEVDSDSNNMFDKLSKRLELLSTTDEKRFQRIYAPQIAALRRIELAINALEFGMKVLYKEDKMYYDIIYKTYIEGERRAPMRELAKELHYSGTSACYRALNQAKKRIASAIFGCTCNKAELISILVYLRQQREDDFFPSFY